MDREEYKVISTGCSHNCGGKCLLKAHVKDGVIRCITTDDSLENFDSLQLRGCVRGRSYRQRIYHPDRLKYPMKRIGERGEGKFERISWDEAYDTIATEMRRIKETYGPEAILNISASGTIYGSLHTASALKRLLNMFGGYTALVTLRSCEGAIFADSYTLGTWALGSEMDDLVNSRLIILWGWDPATAIWGTNTAFYLIQAKEKGCKFVCVDPRYTDSAVALSTQWIPIRPGTDAAMMIAMAYVMIDEGLQDQKFLDAYTIGFQKFQDYVMGKEDGIVKTPIWAEEITGVPAGTIAQLARSYATIKPSALCAFAAPGRTPYGEQFHRVGVVLACMTGNIGIHGGSATLFMTGYPMGRRIKSLSHGPNPTRAEVNFNKWADAILLGKAGGYGSDIKMVYSIAGNTLNQVGNINKGVQALKKVEFVVVHEHFMTTTAKFADILLPTITSYERNDILIPWAFGHYAIFSNKVIEPLYECKSDLEILTELAKRLGINGFNDRTEEEWLKEFLTNSEIHDYERFKQEGAYKISPSEPYVGLKPFIEDPKKNPLPTPSGKIEIYSQRIADMQKSHVLPPTPKYIDDREGLHHPLAKKYPLLMVTIHAKLRCHSIYGNIPWLQELGKNEMWINSLDAEARGIRMGDEVKVFNDLGTIILRAKVTERIMPGVISSDQGAWYEPDAKGIDRGGSANVLCKDEFSPGGAAIFNAILVQVEKAQAK